MTMKLIRCVSSTDVIYDANHNIVSRPTDFNINADVNIGADNRCHIVMEDGRYLHTTTVQKTEEAFGFYVVFTKNSAYLFKKLAE